MRDFARAGRFFAPIARLRRSASRRCGAKLDGGETIYLGGICASGTHNSGVALVEVTRERGPKLICNNEEERFSGERHTTKFPDQSIDELAAMLRRSGLGPERIDAWFSAWDNVAFVAMIARTVAEEAPASFGLFRTTELPALTMRNIDGGMRMARRLGRRLGSPAPVIAVPHHDNHAWFSFAVSPFAKSERPVMVAAIDGFGDRGAITLYVCEGGVMRELYCNNSMFDSLGIFYAVISSTQGGWTLLSSEGRYMGAAAWGNCDRKTNPFYAPLRAILQPGAGRPSAHQSRLGELAARFLKTLHQGADKNPRRADRAQGYVESRMRYCASKTSATRRTPRNASTRRPPRRWCSRTRLFTSSTISSA